MQVSVTIAAQTGFGQSFANQNQILQVLHTSLVVVAEALRAVCSIVGREAPGPKWDVLDQPFAKSVLGLEGSEDRRRNSRRKRRHKKSHGEATHVDSSLPVWMQTQREQAATAAAVKRKTAAAHRRPAAAAAARKRPVIAKRPAAAAAAPPPPSAEKDDDDEDDEDIEQAMCEGEEGAEEEEVQEHPDQEVDAGLIDGAQEPIQIGEHQVRLNRRRTESITIIQVRAPNCSWSQLAQFTDRQWQSQPYFPAQRGCSAREMADTAAKACCCVCLVVASVVAGALVCSITSEVPAPASVSNSDHRQSFGHRANLFKVGKHCERHTMYATLAPRSCRLRRFLKQSSKGVHKPVVVSLLPASSCWTTW